MKILEIVNLAAAKWHDTPCVESVAWMATLPADTTPEQAWNACKDGSWLLWLCGILGVDRKQLVLAACDIAETALVHVQPGEQRPRLAIDTARRWCRGDAMYTETMSANQFASYAASSAYARADYVPTSASSAAYAAASTHSSYAAAVHAADAARIAANEIASGRDAASESLALAADMVRKFIQWPVVEAKLVRFGAVS